MNLQQHQATLASQAPAGWDGAALVPWVEYVSERKDGRVFVSLKANFATREVEGYASTWDEDQGGDTIHPGSFTESVEQRHHVPTRSGAPSIVRFLWQHDKNTPLGPVREMREDDVGLWVRAKLSATLAGNDAYTLLRDGAIDRFSIGYMTFEENTKEKEGGGRDIFKTDVWEFSLVTFPMNMAAKVTAVKSSGGDGASLGQDWSGLSYKSHTAHTRLVVPELGAKGLDVAAVEQVSADPPAGDEQPKEDPMHVTKVEEKAGKVLSGTTIKAAKEVFRDLVSAGKKLSDMLSAAGATFEENENPWLSSGGTYDPRPSDDDDSDQAADPTKPVEKSADPPAQAKANADQDGDETCPVCGTKMRTAKAEPPPEEPKEEEPPPPAEAEKESNTSSSKDLETLLGRFLAFEKSIDQLPAVAQLESATVTDS